MATASGGSPTRRLEATRPVAGSIRTTVPAAAFATHTPALPTARAEGPLPTGIVWVTVPVPGLIRDTVLSSPFATQTEPKP